MNIYEQQSKNKQMTWFIMFLFIILLALVGGGFDFFYLRTGGFPIGTLIAVAISVIWVLASYYQGDRIVLASAGARAVNLSNLKENQLFNVVQEVSIASGLPMPVIYIIPDPDPNAFATGRNPNNSSIAVTEGLLEKLNRDELQGVISHEMSHIKNYDIRLMMIIAALVGAIILIADLSRRAMYSLGRSRGKAKGGALPFLVIWLIFMIFAPIIARLLALAVSRKREYLADATGAELIRNPLALANALDKIENSPAATKSIKQGVAHLCIADPLGRSFTNKTGFVADLMATHPPMDERIRRLKQMAYIYESTNINNTN